MIDETFSADDMLAGERLFARPWTFVKGVVALDGLPLADRPEIAFAGRSNVGKSSLINALADNRTMARTSNTPGRTQELNYFTPHDGAMYLVDLPGYGFAKAPKDKVVAWQTLLKGYLRGRPTLARVFLLVDSRHGVKAVDEEIMELLDTVAVSYQIVLTKADKIGTYDIAPLIAATAKVITAHPAAFPNQLATSSETGDGLACLRATLAMIAREHR